MRYLISYTFKTYTGEMGTGCAEVGTKWWVKLNSQHLINLREKLSKEIAGDKDEIVFIGIYKF